MPILTYNGKMIEVITSNTIIQPNTTMSKNLGFYSHKITWKGSPPPEIRDSNIYQISRLGHGVIVDITTTVEITGTQWYNDSSTPTTSITLYSDSAPPFKEDYMAETIAPSIGNGKYNVNSVANGVTVPYLIDYSVTNVCEPGLGGCLPYATDADYTMSLTVNVTARINCSGSALDTDVCANYCLRNRDECLQDYRRYCFPDKIGTSVKCRNFIGDYIVDVNPLSQLDDDLATYCNSRYAGFGDLLTDPPAPDAQKQIDIKLCACHMPEHQYDRFKSELIKQIPGFGDLGINKRCLISECASSQFKYSSITKAQCDVPDCINIAIFTNNGTFDNSSVTIKQNVSGCSNITGGNKLAPVTPPVPPLPSTSYGWIIAIVIVVIIVALLIIFI